MIHVTRSMIKVIKAFFAALGHTDFRALLFLVFITLCIGTGFYHFIEGLHWFDALYLSVITLTTVGYGDVTPQTVGGKVFTIIYIFFGLGLLLGFVNVIAERMWHGGFFDNSHNSKPKFQKHKLK